MTSSAPSSVAMLRRLVGVVGVVMGALALAGCDLTGAEAADKLAAQREADGKAIGSACRHAGRAIEDCYGLNAKAQRAAVFAGWREMDEYMRENKLEAVPPALSRTDAKGDAAEVAKGDAAPSEPRPAKTKTKAKADHS